MKEWGKKEILATQRRVLGLAGFIPEIVKQLKEAEEPSRETLAKILSDIIALREAGRVLVEETDSYYRQIESMLTKEVTEDEAMRLLAIEQDAVAHFRNIFDKEFAKA